MAYKPRAKGRIRNSVNKTERWERGSGRGPAAGRPQPLIHHLVAKPKDDIAAWSTGLVEEVDIDTDELIDGDIEVHNRSTTILQKDVEYRFDWIQGRWLPYFNDCGATPPPPED